MFDLVFCSVTGVSISFSILTCGLVCTIYTALVCTIYTALVSAIYNALMSNIC